MWRGVFVYYLSTQSGKHHAAKSICEETEKSKWNKIHICLFVIPFFFFRRTPSTKMKNNIFGLNVLEKRFGACFISRGLSFVPAFDELVKSTAPWRIGNHRRGIICLFLDLFFSQSAAWAMRLKWNPSECISIASNVTDTLKV